MSVKRRSTTSTLDQDMIKAVGMIGKVVTYGNDQFKIYQVEGRSWYAFDQGDGSTKIDCDMPVAEYLKEPIMGLIPSGHKIGDGFMIEVPLNSPFVRPGVCLAKAAVDGSAW